MTDREKYTECLHCHYPLIGNKLVIDAYNVNTQHNFLKTNVKVIADMLRDKGDKILSDKLYEIIEKCDKRIKY